jgi:DNA polymerase-3 subunit epsilon
VRLPFRISRRRRTVLDEPFAEARLVALDLETTGPDMHRDRIVAIGSIAVAGGTVRHDDAFEVVVRQARESSVDNILVHRIGGQEQLAGAEPAQALLSCLEHLGGSMAVAFRAEFDSTVLQRELRRCLGRRLHVPFLDLACLLPAFFAGAQNGSLDDWLHQFGLPLVGRHRALADAYACARLLLLVMDRARHMGLATVGDLVAQERAQRWLGRTR